MTLLVMIGEHHWRCRAGHRGAGPTRPTRCPLHDCRASVPPPGGELTPAPANCPLVDLGEKP